MCDPSAAALLAQTRPSLGEFTSYLEIGCSYTCKEAGTYSFNFIVMNKLGILCVLCASCLSDVYITSENA
jgi:hypothetical protein